MKLLYPFLCWLLIGLVFNCQAQSASTFLPAFGYLVRTEVSSPHGAILLYNYQGQHFTYGSLYGAAFVYTLAVPASQSSKNPTKAVPAMWHNYQTLLPAWIAFNNQQ